MQSMDVSLDLADLLGQSPQLVKRHAKLTPISVQF
jgi:hypothetical protein